MARDRMRTIALVSIKGGAGKSMLTSSLATECAAREQPTWVLDADPQCTTMAWSDKRNAWIDNEGARKLRLKAIQLARLPRDLKDAQDEGAARVFIDTEGHAPAAVTRAAGHADLVVIPCKIAAPDIDAIHETVGACRTVEACRAGNVPVVIVPNSLVTIQERLNREAIDALEQHGIAVSPHTVGERVVFRHAAIAGQGVNEYAPTSRAADEIRKLVDWLESLLADSD